MNDTDRAQWVDNDEGLYCWWRGSRLTKREFIRVNRAEITQAIENVTTAKKTRALFALWLLTKRKKPNAY